MALVLNIIFTMLALLDMCLYLTCWLGIALIVIYIIWRILF